MSFLDRVSKVDVSALMDAWRAEQAALLAAERAAHAGRHPPVRNIHLPNPLLDAYVAAAKTEKEGAA